MLMADAFAITMLFVGLMIVLPATWLMFGALWPSAVERARERIPTMPVGTFLIGAGVTLVFITLTTALGNANLPALALPIAAFGMGWAFLGMSAVARHVGRRLATPGQPEWRAHLKGGIVLSLSFLVPVLGTFLIFPIALVLGTGAATLAVFRRPRPVETPAMTPAPEARPEEKVEVPA